MRGSQMGVRAKARADGRLLSGQTATLEREQWCVHGGLGVAAAMARARQDLRVRIPSIL